MGKPVFVINPNSADSAGGASGNSAESAYQFPFLTLYANQTHNMGRTDSEGNTSDLGFYHVTTSYKKFDSPPSANGIETIYPGQTKEITASLKANKKITVLGYQDLNFNFYGNMAYSRNLRSGSYPDQAYSETGDYYVSFVNHNPNMIRVTKRNADSSFTAGSDLHLSNWGSSGRYEGIIKWVSGNVFVISARSYSGKVRALAFEVDPATLTISTEGAGVDVTPSTGYRPDISIDPTGSIMITYIKSNQSFIRAMTHDAGTMNLTMGTEVALGTTGANANSANKIAYCPQRNYHVVMFDYNGSTTCLQAWHVSGTTITQKIGSSSFSAGNGRPEDFNSDLIWYAPLNRMVACRKSTSSTYYYYVWPIACNATSFVNYAGYKFNNDATANRPVKLIYDPTKPTYSRVYIMFQDSGGVCQLARIGWNGPTQINNVLDKSPASYNGSAEYDSWWNPNSNKPEIIMNGYILKRLGYMPTNKPILDYDDYTITYTVNGQPITINYINDNPNYNRVIKLNTPSKEVIFKATFANTGTGTTFRAGFGINPSGSYGSPSYYNSSQNKLNCLLEE